MKRYMLPVLAVVLTAGWSAVAAEGGKDGEVKQVVVSSLPENVKLIIGEGKSTLYVPRVKAVHELGDDLPADQLKAFNNFLYKKIETQELPELEFNGIKNELVFALMKQKTKPADLAGHLVAMYKDKSYDLVWRDYCVQFFGKWYDEAPDNEGKKEMVKCLYEAMSERDNRIAGIAGSMLSHLAGRPGFDRLTISDLVYGALTAADCAKESKVSLLQACAQLKNYKALPLAREWAANEKDMMLRVSAIGYLGLLGDSSDLPLLEKYSRSSDIRLQLSAAAAIKKIKK